MAARLPYLDRTEVWPEIQAIYDAANFTNRFNEALGTELEEARHG